MFFSGSIAVYTLITFLVIFAIGMLIFGYLWNKNRKTRRQGFAQFDLES